MIKIAVHCKQGLEINTLFEAVKDHGHFELVENEPHYVFTFGGDGTFLEAIQLYGVDPVYIPINMGNLGFYTSWKLEDIQEAINAMMHGKVLNLSMIEVSFEKEGNIQKLFCLNEAVMITPTNTQIADVYIDGKLIEHFRGTGLCVSTPSGSTAYNRSLGGSIIQSDLEVMQLTRIAPINSNSYRSLTNPLVLGKNNYIDFVSNEKDVVHSILTVDRLVHHLEGVTSLRFKIADEKIKLLVPRDNNFWLRVKRSFL